MQNPCEKCKKKNNCHNICYPLKDYLRGQKKRKRNEKKN